MFPNAEDFVGKTVTSYDSENIGTIRFGFADGSHITLEVENYNCIGQAIVVREEETLQLVANTGNDYDVRRLVSTPRRAIGTGAS